MIEVISKQINQQLILGAILGFIVGFLFSKITGKFFRWLFILAILAILGYIYYKRG